MDVKDAQKLGLPLSDHKHEDPDKGEWEKGPACRFCHLATDKRPSLPIAGRPTSLIRCNNPACPFVGAVVFERIG